MEGSWAVMLYSLRKAWYKINISLHGGNYWWTGMLHKGGRQTVRTTFSHDEKVGTVPLSLFIWRESRLRYRASAR